MQKIIYNHLRVEAYNAVSYENQGNSKRMFGLQQK
jgi:hypothetical protein